MFSIQEREEQDYDTQSEYLAVLRQEHHDPYEFAMECEEHGEVFDVRHENCPKCPVFIPKTREDLILEGLLPEDDDPPF
jgi:hypothetical protein